MRQPMAAGVVYYVLTSVFNVWRVETELAGFETLPALKLQD
jgi:hypothetical protein